MTKQIILASQSPRRYELMKMAGLEFEVKSKNVDETHPLDTLPEKIPVYLAQKKAKAFSWLKFLLHQVVIGCRHHCNSGKRDF